MEFSNTIKLIMKVILFYFKRVFLFFKISLLVFFSGPERKRSILALGEVRRNSDGSSKRY